MNTHRILVLSLLILAVASVSSRDHRNFKERHYATDACCTRSGGTVCGRMISSCCKSGCQKYWWGGQGCKDDQTLEVVCKSCSDDCVEKLGGTVCGVSISAGSISCCMTEHCVKPSGGLGDKILDKVVDKATSQITKAVGIDLFNSNTTPEQKEEKQQTEQSHKALADKLLGKFLGPASYCKAGKVLKLPQNCIPDSWSNLLMARIF